MARAEKNSSARKVRILLGLKEPLSLGRFGCSGRSHLSHSQRRLRGRG